MELPQQVRSQMEFGNEEKKHTRARACAGYLGTTATKKVYLACGEAGPLLTPEAMTVEPA
jgi:hypothetical protein